MGQERGALVIAPPPSQQFVRWAWGWSGGGRLIQPGVVGMQPPASA